ncbi:unnamed protein product [Schistosoma mattheei]|uniref:C2H2-type domain-containing protein n=3 Tax=Schistosoma mattheei TaxID=31246 RepID=A0AA85BD21_9TREM|nr:unnamed protein product [Schistosoma mattheei]
MNSASTNFQCTTLLPDCLNSNALKTSSLYMRRWRRRQYMKLKTDRLEGQQCQQQQQQQRQKPLYDDFVSNTNYFQNAIINLNQTVDSIPKTNSMLAISELTNYSGDTSITTSSTIDVTYTNSDNNSNNSNNNNNRSYQSLSTNTSVTSRSNADAEFCKVSNSTPAMFNGGVTSPGNYKKILIDRYLLSQSMSHCGTIYESISPFTKMVHVPLLKETQTDYSNEKTMKVPLNTDTNYHLETKSTIPEKLINRKKSNSSDNEIRNFQSFLRKLLCDILTRELLPNKYKDEPNMIQSTVSSNHNRYCNTLSPQNPISAINDRIYNPDSSNTETKLSFNNENYEQAISTPCFYPNFLNELQSLLRNNCYSDDMKGSDHQPTVMQILTDGKNSSLYTCLDNSTSSLLEINSNNQLKTPLLGMHNSNDKLLCPEVIEKNSVDTSKPQHSQKSSYHSLAETSMSQMSKDSINNNDTVNTTATTVFSPNFLHSIHSSVKNHNIQNSTFDSLLLVCSQPYTTVSIDSKSSTLTSSTCTTHRQQQYTSVETSVSYPSSPLFKYRYPIDDHKFSSTPLHSSLFSPTHIMPEKSFDATIITSTTPVTTIITTNSKMNEQTITHQSHLPFMNTSIAPNQINTTNVNQISMFNNNDNNNNNTLVQSYSDLLFMDVDNYQCENSSSCKQTVSNITNNCTTFNTFSSVRTLTSNKHSNTTSTTTNDTNKSSSINSSLIQHRTSNGLYVCMVCSRQFTRSDMLVRHAHVHTGHKPFECIICGQAFSRSDHLSTHQRTHTGQRPYQCSLCYYSASRRDMITRHLRVHQRKGQLVSTNESGGPMKLHFTINFSQPSKFPIKQKEDRNTCSVVNVTDNRFSVISSQSPHFNSIH